MAILQKTVVVPDVSFYQDDNSTPQKIDFVKMKNAGARGVIIRAGQGGWTDEDFTYNWQAAKAAGLPRGLYWYYDSRYTPASQAQRVASLLSINGLPEMELWVDYEEKYNGPYAGWRHMAVFIAELEKLLPAVRIGIYTGYYYWLEHCPDPATEKASFLWFGKYPLWIAWYTMDASIVKIPGPWSNALYWQYTAKGPGSFYGVESLGIDLSYFNGSEIDFSIRYSSTFPPPADTVVVREVDKAGTYEKIPLAMTVRLTANGVKYAVDVDQRPVVVPPPPPPSTGAGIYEILDDLHALIEPAGPRPNRSSIWPCPATVRVRGGASSIQLTPPWMDFAHAINTGLAYNYQFDNSTGDFKRGVGWCNQGVPDTVERVTMAGNRVKVLRIGDVVDGVLTNPNRAYIETYFIDQKPPVVPTVLPMPGKLDTLIHMFTVQYADHLDWAVAGPKGPRYPRLFVISNPGEQLWIDLRDLKKV